MQRQYGYDNRANITAITDQLNGGESQSFGYDALGRLTQATGGYGSLGYSYDAVGNRLSQNDDGAVSGYQYGSGSHRLLSVTGTNPMSFAYDAAGNATQRGTLGFAYNQASRPATIYSGGTPIVNQGFNAWGQRVLKTTAAGSTVYHYDSEGQLIAETTATGSPLREYVYLDGQPLALHADGQTYYLHTDHLGTPQAATDSAAQVVWQARYQPFGQVELTASITQPLRFPGQYDDPETGLYQNHHRDYDPLTGRYIESDPIGLLAGLNTYAYVGSNPIKYIDPLGLWTFQMGFGGNVNIGWAGGINLAGGFGFAIDDSGNIATYGFGGGGIYGGTPGFVGGIQVAVSNAEDVCALEGPADYGSISGGVGPAISIDGFQANVGRPNYYRGNGITLGVGIEAGGAFGETFTGIGPVGVLW